MMYKQKELTQKMFDSNLHIKLVVRIILTFFLALILIPGVVEAQNKEVVAKKGDGIYRLLQRYGLSYSEYRTDFIELNKTKLGKDNALFAGRKYKLPVGKMAAVTTPKVSSGKGLGITKKYEIFGKKWEDVRLDSEDLKGAVFYLMAGHGGPDPGAVGRYGGKQVCEDEYAYDVTLRLARNLIQEGAKVYMITRDKNDGIREEIILKTDYDEVCYPNLRIPRSPKSRLRQRTHAVNKLYTKHKGSYQRMLSVHVDSRSVGENIDVFFYHAKGSKTGNKLAKNLQQTFQQKYAQHQPGRGYKGTVSSRSLFVIKNTHPPAVLIELGNINHKRDIQRMVKETNRQALANWLLDGLEKDFKNNK